MDEIIQNKYRMRREKEKGKEKRKTVPGASAVFNYAAAFVLFSLVLFPHLFFG